jgi:hypothetical protein
MLTHALAHLVRHAAKKPNVSAIKYAERPICEFSLLMRRSVPAEAGLFGSMATRLGLTNHVWTCDLSRMAAQAGRLQGRKYRRPWPFSCGGPA